MRRWFFAAAMMLGCGAKDPGPSEGTYTVEFPSTQAAVVTDFVQIFVFDIPDQSKRAGLCEQLISARITNPNSLKPSVVPPDPAANICEMLQGQRPVTIPYGEHALLAVGQQKKKDKENKDTLQDFLIGCSIMSIGEGDAPLPIQLRQVNSSQALPPTTCQTVGDFCGRTCG